MYEPTMGTATDPERDVAVTPRRLGVAGATASVLLVVSLLLLVIWLVPTDDAADPIDRAPVTTVIP